MHLHSKFRLNRRSDSKVILMKLIKKTIRDDHTTWLQSERSSAQCVAKIRATRTERTDNAQRAEERFHMLLA